MSPLGTFQFFNPNRSSDPDDRRKKGRVGVEELQCSAGDVIDISSTGARLQLKRRWPEGETREVSLAGSHVSATLSAKCVWERKEGFRKHVVGVQFVECTPEQEVVLNELARRYAVRSWGAPRGVNDFDLEALEKKEQQSRDDEETRINAAPEPDADPGSGVSKAA